MTDNPINKQTFLYQFLVSSKYRIARHILLLVAVAAVSLNQNNASAEKRVCGRRPAGPGPSGLRGPYAV